MVFNPGFTLNNTEAPVWLVLEGTGSSRAIINIESSAGTPGLAITVEEWNWTTNNYEVVGIENESVEDDSLKIFPIMGHIEDQVGRIRIGWRPTGMTVNFPWEARLNFVMWETRL